MKNLVIAELERMTSRKMNKIFFFASIIVLVLFASWVRFFNVGFYDPNITMEINSLNFAPFVLRDYHLYLMFIFCPFIFTESLCHESVTGCLRLVLTRTYNKREVIVSKFLCCMIVSGLFLLIIFIFATLFGYLFVPKVDYTHFFNIEHSFGGAQALLYNMKFYALEYLVVVALLGISAFVSVILPNTVLAFIGTLGVSIGSLYISDAFEFFISSNKIIFDVLANINTSFFYSVIPITAVSMVLSVIFFSKKDYLY